MYARVCVYVCFLNAAVGCCTVLLGCCVSVLREIPEHAAGADDDDAQCAEEGL